jgi:CHAD domain-containing protein
MDEVKESARPAAMVADVPAPPEPAFRPRLAKESVTPAPNEEWKKIRKLAVHQLERFMSLEPKVLRGDDADAIHDMRVASRRLQQVFDLLYPPPCSGQIRKLRRVIRRSRRLLSEVRNCDVLLENVGAHLARKRASRREVWTAVEHFLHQRRSEHFEKAMRKISKMNVAGFYVNLKSQLIMNGNKPDPGTHTPGHAVTPELGREQFYRRIGQSLGRATQAFENQIERTRRDPSTSVIHGVRIATKRLRYLIEVLREFDVAGSADFLGWLRQLQRLLGGWHDIVVLEQAMIELVARPEFLRDHVEIAMEIEKLMVRNRKTRKNLEDRYFLVTLDSPELGQMKKWIAHLESSPSAAFAIA